MYGHERSTKAWSDYDHELYARLHAVERENTRRVPKSTKSQVISLWFYYFNATCNSIEFKDPGLKHSRSI